MTEPSARAVERAKQWLSWEADTVLAESVQSLAALLDVFAAEAVREEAIARGKQQRAAVAHTVREENEACARLVETWDVVVNGGVPMRIAAAIRARHAGEGERGCSCPPPYHHPACPMKPTP